MRVPVHTLPVSLWVVQRSRLILAMRVPANVACSAPWMQLAWQRDTPISQQASSTTMPHDYDQNKLLPMNGATSCGHA
jgi:hypothetical protein